MPQIHSLTDVFSIYRLSATVQSPLVSLDSWRTRERLPFVYGPFPSSLLSCHSYEFYRYKDSYLTFVNSHLAAFESMVQKRNQEVVDIGRSLSFPVDGGRDMWAPNLRPELDRVVGMLGMYDSQ